LTGSKLLFVKALFLEPTYRFQFPISVGNVCTNKTRVNHIFKPVNQAFILSLDGKFMLLLKCINFKKI